MPRRCRRLRNEWPAEKAPFYGFGPEEDGYLGWTQEADRDRMLKRIENDNQAYFTALVPMMVAA